jgi:hypothetical protein
VIYCRLLCSVFQEFVTRSDVAEALKEFCAGKETNITVVMGLHIDGDRIQRDIAVFHSAKPEVAHEVCFSLVEYQLGSKIKNQEFVRISATKGDKYMARFCRVCHKKITRRETRFLCALYGVP